LLPAYSLSLIVVGFTQQLAVYPESISTGTWLPSRCAATGLHVTVFKLTQEGSRPMTYIFVQRLYSFCRSWKGYAHAESHLIIPLHLFFFSVETLQFAYKQAVPVILKSPVEQGRVHSDSQMAVPSCLPCAACNSSTTYFSILCFSHSSAGTCSAKVASFSTITGEAHYAISSATFWWPANGLLPASVLHTLEKRATCWCRWEIRFLSLLVQTQNSSPVRCKKFNFSVLSVYLFFYYFKILLSAQVI
jgi:hypothetical protein